VLSEDFILFYPGKRPPSPIMIRTGLPKLDSFIAGKLKFAGLLQLSGEAGAGKSQLLFSIIANNALRNLRILLFDSQLKFRPERVRQMVPTDTSVNILEKVDVLQSGDPFVIYQRAIEALSSSYDLILFDDMAEPFLSQGYKSRESSMLSLLGRKMNVWALMKGRFVVATQRLSFNPLLQQNIPLGEDLLAPYLLSEFRLSKLKDYYSISWEGSGEVSRFTITEEGLKEI
jgi:hypothetical protein